MAGATQSAFTFPTAVQSPTGAKRSGTTTATSTTSPEPAVAVQSRATMQTPSGFIATAPINGLAAGSYVIVHLDGTVSASAPDGTLLWNHGSLEFTQWTGRYPTVRSGAPPTPSTPIVWVTLDPVYPFYGGEYPFAVGDLNGDGVDDIAVAHFFYAVIAIDGYNNGNLSIGGTFVSVLDGRTGALIWSYMFPGSARNLAIENGMLIIADDTGNLSGGGGQLGQNGSVSNLDAWKFDNSSGTLQVSRAWTVSTGVQWATWLSLANLPNGQFAASWSDAQPGSGSSTLGHVLVVSLANGTTNWSVTTSGYPRYLRYDSSRNQVVAIEEADPTLTYAYTIVARNVADGSTANSVAENDATPTNFKIGDLDGDGQAEWVVSDLGYLPCAPMVCLGLQDTGRVLAINGTTGSQEWAQIRSGNPVDPNNPIGGTPSPRPYGLVLVPTATGADVIVGSFISDPAGDVELERLSGALSLSGPAGTVLWSHQGPNEFLPQSVSVYQQGGAPFVRAASSRDRLYGYSTPLDQAGTTLVNNGQTPFQVVRSYDLANGNQVSVAPLLSRIHAATGTDVNGDGVTDLIVGGESGAVFALDGTKIDNNPRVLWRRIVAGQVHQIAAADLDGDGRNEIVVAASHAVDVLDSATGNLRYEIPYSPDYIWNFALADLNGDGKIDIVVPSASSIKAYSGPDGSTLWTYTPSGTQAVGTLFSNVAITEDKIVTAQFAYGTQNQTGRTGSGFTRAVVGISGASGTVLWNASEASSSPLDTTKSSFPQFWHGTVAGHLDGVLGSVTGYSWVSYDSVPDAFTLEMEIRDALTGNIIAPPVSSGNGGSYGTFLIPEQGIVSYVGNESWLLTLTQSGMTFGNDIPFDLAQGNFGVLGKRLVEQSYGAGTYLFGQNGLTFIGPPNPIPHAASYNSGISPYREYLQDLDHDGSDEIIRTQWDWDGYEALTSTIQGFGYEQTAHSDGLDILSVLPVPVQLTSVVSRKTHGSAGAFDVDLMSGGVECRSGGANGDYTLVLTFANPLTNAGTARVTTGTGSVSSNSIDLKDAHNYVVNLTGVANAQTITVSVTNVSDSVGNFSATVPISMNVLVGDTTGNRVVNSSDIAQTQSQSGQPVTAANFRQDVTVNGAINSSDIALVQSKSGTGLP